MSDSVLFGVFLSFDILAVLYIFIFPIHGKKSKDKTGMVKSPENIRAKIADNKLPGHYFDGDNIYSVSP